MSLNVIGNENNDYNNRLIENNSLDNSDCDNKNTTGKNIQDVSVSLDTDKETCCRICFESKDTIEDPLIFPCLCNGSSKFVHKNCLNAWINNHHPDEDAYNMCMECNYKYQYEIIDHDLPYLYHYWTMIITNPGVSCIYVIISYFIKDTNIYDHICDNLNIPTNVCDTKYIFISSINFIYLVLNLFVAIILSYRNILEWKYTCIFIFFNILVFFGSQLLVLLFSRLFFIFSLVCYYYLYTENIMDSIKLLEKKRIILNISNDN